MFLRAAIRRFTVWFSKARRGESQVRTKIRFSHLWNQNISHEFWYGIISRDWIRQIEDNCMFYILNESGRVVRTVTTAFDTAALKSAGYTVVESQRNLAIDTVEVHGFPEKPAIIEKRPPILPEITLT